MKNKVVSIISKREIIHSPSFGIVYEWEDIIAKSLGLKISLYGTWHRRISQRIEKYGFVDLYHMLLPTSELRIQFVMTAGIKKNCSLDKNTIPVIIDFWLSKADLPSFYDAYRKCPLVLITSAEVMSFLKDNDCPLPIEHWPLSIPDQYLELLSSSNTDKVYDLVLLGRPNPFFIRLLDSYCAEYPDFEYITSRGDMNLHRTFVTNKGRVVAEDEGRKSYIEMIRKTKITCYTTPGIDEAKKETNSFNQVTPRLLEMICGGCHVIGHYTDNPDTRYYSLQEFVPNINSYDDFKCVLNKMRCSSPDNDLYQKYINKHKTSIRAYQLKEILKKNFIYC